MSKLLQGDQTTPAFANPGTLAWSVSDMQTPTEASAYDITWQAACCKLVTK